MPCTPFPLFPVATGAHVTRGQWNSDSLALWPRISGAGLPSRRVAATIRVAAFAARPLTPRPLPSFKLWVEALGDFWTLGEEKLNIAIRGAYSFPQSSF